LTARQVSKQGGKHPIVVSFFRGSFWCSSIMQCQNCEVSVRLEGL
jgi:hypothetical protein